MVFIMKVKFIEILSTCFPLFSLQHFSPIKTSFRVFYKFLEGLNEAIFNYSTLKKRLSRLEATAVKFVYIKKIKWRGRSNRIFVERTILSWNAIVGRLIIICWG